MSCAALLLLGWSGVDGVALGFWWDLARFILMIKFLGIRSDKAEEEEEEEEAGRVLVFWLDVLPDWAQQSPSCLAS